MPASTVAPPSAASPPVTAAAEPVLPRYFVLALAGFMGMAAISIRNLEGWLVASGVLVTDRVRVLDAVRAYENAGDTSGIEAALGGPGGIVASRASVAATGSKAASGIAKSSSRARGLSQHRLHQARAGLGERAAQGFDELAVGVGGAASYAETLRQVRPADGWP